MAPDPALADAASSAQWAGLEAAETVDAAAAPGRQIDASYPPTQLPGRQEGGLRSDNPSDTALEMFA